MGLGAQLLEGTLYLTICSVVHAVFLTWCIERIRRYGEHLPKPVSQIRVLGVVLGLLLAIVLSHTFQVWLWAWALHHRDALTDWNSAVYFSLVTYSALGYGDIVLSPDARVFAAMASVTGLLNFGVSTAFLVATWSKVFGARLE